MSTVVLVGADADLTFAAVILLLVVAAASVFGYAPGLSAAVTSVAALNYYFTPPLHSFRIGEPDDILALVAFVTVSLLVGATIARLNELRTRAEIHAREASLRVTLTHELRRGLDVEVVLRRLALELSELFDLSECRIALDQTDPTDGDVLVDVPPLRIRAVQTRAMAAGELGVIRGLAERGGDDDRAGTTRRASAREAESSASSTSPAPPCSPRSPTICARRWPRSRLRAARSSPVVASGRGRTTRVARGHVERGGSPRAPRRQGDRGGTDSQRRRAARTCPQRADRRRAVVDRASTRAFDHQRVELAVAPELPAVDVDVLLMDHVLTNLLENAALHGASERPIEIRGSSDGTTVRLAVVDHGAGVPSAEREQIFGEFVRRQASTDGNGTGLGAHDRPRARRSTRRSRVVRGDTRRGCDIRGRTPAQAPEDGT